MSQRIENAGPKGQARAIQAVIDFAVETKNQHMEASSRARYARLVERLGSDPLAEQHWGETEWARNNVGLD